MGRVKAPRRIKMHNIVILTGAGISAESGLETFWAWDGLWANHRIDTLCRVRTRKVELMLWQGKEPVK